MGRDDRLQEGTHAARAVAQVYGRGHRPLTRCAPMQVASCSWTGREDHVDFMTRLRMALLAHNRSDAAAASVRTRKRSSIATQAVLTQSHDVYTREQALLDAKVSPGEFASAHSDFSCSASPRESALSALAGAKQNPFVHVDRRCRSTSGSWSALWTSPDRSATSVVPQSFHRERPVGNAYPSRRGRERHRHDQGIQPLQFHRAVLSNHLSRERDHVRLQVHYDGQRGELHTAVVGVTPKNPHGRQVASG